MAQQVIATGAVSGDGTGDPGRTAWTKANANYTDLYTQVAANLTTLNTTITALGTVQNFNGVDSGAVNAYVVTPTAGGPTFALTVGMVLRFLALNGNTGAGTLNAGGTGIKTVVGQQGATLTGGEVLTSGPTWVQWNGAAWQIVGTGTSPDKVRSAAEITAVLTPVNYFYVPGHALRYGTNTTPGTTDMTAALQATINQAQQAIGADAVWPPGTYLVGTLTVNGSGYNIRTGGGRSTILAQKTGTSSTTGQILIVTGANINIGDLAFTGNIATDTGEFHHCAYCFDDALVATIRNIHFGDLYGTNIRGDVLYVGGILARPTTGIRFGTVSGTNVFRSLLSVAGGEVTGDAVIHDGPVGYRDFDVEPNTGGTYQPATLILNYCRAGIVQVTSDDTTLLNDLVQIGMLDSDFNRVAATTPGYTSPPGVNAQAVIVTNCRLLKIGYWKARNYNYSPLTSGTAALKSNIIIDLADIANCDITEAVFNSLFADQGFGGIAYLEIGNLIATLTATTKMVFNGNGMSVRVRRGTVSGGLLAASIPNYLFENMTVNMNSAVGNAVNTCINGKMNDVAFTNATLGGFLVNCTGSTFQNVTGTFAASAVEVSGCADNRYNHCTLNGIEYTSDFISGSLTTKAMADTNQTLAASESAAPLIRTTGVLTAQRNLIVSLASGRQYNIDNSCTGFGVQVIGATGTGIVVGVGKHAALQCDGTNIIRIGADV